MVPGEVAAEQLKESPQFNSRIHPDLGKQKSGVKGQIE